MPDLWETLGYDTIASEVAEVLQIGADLAVVQGPPGVGKSWLAKGIGTLWEASGGSAIVAEGDSLRGEVAFYPFAFAMAELSSGFRSFVPAVAGAARAGEVLLGTAGVITSTVEGLGAIRGRRRRSKAILLTDGEQDILHELERLMKKRPLLLIADNLHWWDAASLEFLGRLRTPRMREAFPFLAQLRVLAVETPEPYQTVVSPQAHDAVLAPSSTKLFRLSRIRREQFGDVLAALGPGTSPPEAVSAIYALSGGHLALASRCASRLASDDAALFLAATDSDEFVQRLLTDRLRALGEMGRLAVALLQIGAVWGLTFRRDEVECTSGSGKTETSRLLRYCRDEAVLELSEERCTFVHDLYRQYFLSVDAEDRVGIHERMSDCLRILRPAEYDLRCLNALSAERPRHAGALGVHAALQAQREGRAWGELPTTVLEAVTDAGLMSTLERLATAVEHVRAYRIRECLAALDGLPHDLPKSLVAEGVYVRATCLMSTRAGVDRAQARSVLEAWTRYEEEEPELGIRLMRVLLYGLFHLRESEPGLGLEAQIRGTLIDRVEFDPAAKDTLYTLDRCAGGLYPVDVSVVRNREAVAHFAPREGQTLVRRPVEYYRCLVNLGASLVSNALYADAAAAHEQLDRLMAEYPEGVFPRLDFPRMNALLADYRLGRVDADEAVRRQSAIAAETPASNDPFYARNALAVYLALAGRNDDAITALYRLLGELEQQRDQPEPSMVYLIRANHCMARFVAGEDVQADWRALDAVVDVLAYPSRPIYVRRHALLSEVVAQHETLSADELDEVLLKRHPAEMGPPWRDYGRGFMLPAIELWREN